MQYPVIIVKGLKFTSSHFQAKAEVSAVRETEIDVILTPSDGFSWEEKGWSLQHVKDCFDRGGYKVVELNQVNISVF